MKSVLINLELYNCYEHIGIGILFRKCSLYAFSEQHTSK